MTADSINNKKGQSISEKPCSLCGKKPEVHANPLKHTEIDGEIYHGWCYKEVTNPR